MLAYLLLLGAFPRHLFHHDLSSINFASTSKSYCGKLKKFAFEVEDINSNFDIRRQKRLRL